MLVRDKQERKVLKDQIIARKSVNNTSFVHNNKPDTKISAKVHKKSHGQM